MKRSGPFVVAIGFIAYVSAVTQRSSMGVASLAATAKFHTTAEQLSALAVAQLVMYAAMQIPVGLMLDRFGARKVLTLGAVSMSLGQFIVAFSPTLEMAVAGRMLVGFGDAFTFISLIRIVNTYYDGPRASQLQQWLGNSGQIGQIISAVPFAFVLREAGWIQAFSLWATIAAILACCCWVFLLDPPANSTAQHGGIRQRLADLRDAVKKPSARMAFWTHWMTQSSTNALVLLWGIPFLEAGEGLPADQAKFLLSLFVIIGIVFGFAFGQLCAFRPHLRKPLLTATTSTVLLAWAVLIAYPGKAPMWLLASWVVIVAINAPASMVALDYTRQYVDKKILGSVNGFVNIGGFSAGLSMMFVIGVVLDLYYNIAGKGLGLQLYSLNGFRLAFIAVILIVGLGLVLYRYSEAQTRKTEDLGRKP
ncbi:MAG: hypothetical protein RJA35_312 [Actinomycetota bacterium]